MNIRDKYRAIEGTKKTDGIIRILDEKYKNVSVAIGEVSFKPIEDSDEAKLSYKYDVIESPENIEIDGEFDTLLGDIIVDILESNLEEDPDSLRFNDSAD
jgi:hypothetical protein